MPIRSMATGITATATGSATTAGTTTATTATATTETGTASAHSNFTGSAQRAPSGGSESGTMTRTDIDQTRGVTMAPNGAVKPKPEARLLVVDDEPNIVELLSASLRYAGFEVDIARSGPEAVRVARMVNPDLLVLDVMMPGMDGFDVVRRLRADGVRVPVLFLTARDSTEDKISGLTLGGDDYVTKPFSLEEVIARIRAILRRFEVEQENKSSPKLAFADIELD